MIGSGVAAATFASGHIFGYMGWVTLGAARALVLAAAGITMIRTRGETAVAVLSLVLGLSRSTFASPLSLYGALGSFGG